MTPEKQQDLVRKSAEYQAALATESHLRLIDEHKAAFRWIVASLFALNGGAILSILSRSGTSLVYAMPSFGAFFAGIVTTFVCVVFAQISDKMMIGQMHRSGLYWTSVSVIGERDPESETQISRGVKSSELVGKFSRFLAIFAMIFFLLGALSLAVIQQKIKIEQLQTQLKAIDVLEGE